MSVAVVNLKNAGVVLMTENFVSDGRKGERRFKETVHGWTVLMTTNL